MLTDEQLDILNTVNEWGKYWREEIAIHADTLFVGVEVLEMALVDLVTTLLVRQRDRKRLRRVLGVAKEFRYQVLAWKDRYQDNQDNLFRANLKMGRARRWSAAWKAAAKKWLAKAAYYRDGQLEADNIHLWERHRVLVAERDELCRRHNELFNLWEAASGEAAKLETERDELQRRLGIAENHKQEICREHLKVLAERDELQRELKAVTDCILHYAPADFPILKYDSAAEALAGLLDGGNTNEPNTDKPR